MHLYHRDLWTGSSSNLNYGGLNKASVLLTAYAIRTEFPDRFRQGGARKNEKYLYGFGQKTAVTNDITTTVTTTALRKSSQKYPIVSFCCSQDTAGFRSGKYLWACPLTWIENQCESEIVKRGNYPTNWKCFHSTNERGIISIDVQRSKETSPWNEDLDKLRSASSFVSHTVTCYLFVANALYCRNLLIRAL
jgi:hypothetical protein